jgi:hypothetical protein
MTKETTKDLLLKAFDNLGAFIAQNRSKINSGNSEKFLIEAQDRIVEGIGDVSRIIKSPNLVRAERVKLLDSSFSNLNIAKENLKRAISEATAMFDADKEALIQEIDAIKITPSNEILITPGMNMGGLEELLPDFTPPDLTAAKTRTEPPSNPPESKPGKTPIEIGKFTLRRPQPNTRSSGPGTPGKTIQFPGPKSNNSPERS